MLLRVLPSIRRVERLVGPRLIWLTTRRGEQIIGLFAFVLAVVLFLPVPFGNTLPALAIAILALAVLERDGIAAIAGTLVGVSGDCGRVRCRCWLDEGRDLPRSIGHSVMNPTSRYPCAHRLRYPDGSCARSETLPCHST